MKENELASALRTAISRINRKLRKHMNAMGGLSISEIDSLSFLYNNGSLSPTGLADLHQIKGQSMSEIITRLKTLGLIDKQVSDTDKRKFDITLTRSGRQMVEQTREERDEWLSRAIAKNLTDQEKKILAESVSILGKLSEVQQ